MIGLKVDFSYLVDEHPDVPAYYNHSSGIVLDKLTSFWSGTTYLIKNDNNGSIFKISPDQIYNVHTEPKTENLPKP